MQVDERRAVKWNAEGIACDANDVPVDDVKPQHDLDERKRLGREIGLANARRSQGSAWLDAVGVGEAVESLGMQALESAEYQRGYSAGWKSALAIFGSSAIKSGVARMWAYLGR